MELEDIVYELACLHESMLFCCEDRSGKEDLDDFVVHWNTRSWNTRRRQVKLKGLTPEEFRRQSLAA